MFETYDGKIFSERKISPSLKEGSKDTSFCKMISSIYFVCDSEVLIT